MEPVNPTSPAEQQPRFIPWEEQLQDHTRKLEEYLQNLLFRGCTLETTARNCFFVGSCSQETFPVARKTTGHSSLRLIIVNDAGVRLNVSVTHTTAC